MSKYKFSEIAINSTAKKKPVEEDKYTYIGLEHLDSGTLTVSRWGADVAPIGEKLIMKKGDVLFGKRRAYQKKVGIAPFDGIFSAHGMVLRPKEKVITREYFPLFISSDYFLDKAIQISVGSLSPTINWKDLKNLEFEIPSIEEQQRVAPVIWAAIDTKNAYNKLLQETDELIKSQFIEMFGDPNGESKHEKVKFSKCSSNLTKGPFGSDMKKSLYVDKSDSTYKVYLQLNALQKDQSLGEYCISESYFKQKMFKYEVKPGDFIITCDGTLGEMLQLKEPMERGVISPSLMRVSLLNDKMNDRYFEALWKYYMLPVMAGQARNSCLMHLPSAKTLGAIEVPLPSLELQKVYSEFLEQSDKSKFVVENSG